MNSVLASDRISFFDRKTALVLLACAVGMGAGAYLLEQDFAARGGVGVGAPMAKVERAEARVQRKLGSEFLWTNVEVDDPLYRHDSILTGQGSAATVHFNDGTVVEVGENSLIVVNDVEHLAAGFMRGSIVLKQATGDSQISRGADGVAKIEQLPVRLVKPEPLAALFTAANSEKQVALQWQVRAGLSPEVAAQLGDGLKVKISSERSFRSAKTQTLDVADSPTNQLSAGANTSMTASLKPGRYFWRLVDAKGPVTEIAQFRVVAAEPLQPVSPISSQKISSYGESFTVQVHWATPTDADERTSQMRSAIQISHDPELKEGLINTAVDAATGIATLKGLTEGAYSWRLVTKYGDFVVTSPVEHFSLEKAKRLSLAQEQPLEGSGIRFGNPVKLSWSCEQCEGEPTHFTVEVQSAAGQKVKTIETEGGLTATWEKPPTGFYRWHVTAFRKGVNVGETEFRKLGVVAGEPLVLRSPGPNQEIRFWETEPSFAFTWDADSLVTSSSPDSSPNASPNESGAGGGFKYALDVSTDALFKSAVNSTETTGTSVSSATLKLPQGTFYWRVRVVDSSKQTFKTSPVSKFIFGYFPLLHAPQVSSAPISPVYNLLEQESPISLKWAKVEDATEYELTLESEGSPTAVGQSRQPSSVATQKFRTPATQFEFKNLKEGQYRWRVQAVDRVKRLGVASAQQPFQVTYGAPLAAPESVSPEVQ